MTPPLKTRKTDLVSFLLLFSLSLFLLFVSEESKIEMSRAAIRAGVSPVQRALSFVTRPFRVYSENNLLRRELTELSLKNDVLKECGEENKRLRMLLELKQKMEYDIEPAEIVGKDPGRLPAVLLIARGAREGMRRDLPCITHQGLVGKIVEVSTETALVQTIFDPDSRVSCLIQRSRVLGILRYRAAGCVLEDVLLRSDVQVGDEIVSSGMGGVFPKGLKVGTVSALGSERKGLFRKVAVEPAVDLSRTEEVFVVLRPEKGALAMDQILPAKDLSHPVKRP